MTTELSTEILDTTLREGEQCYGVFFPVKVKKRIAILLDEIGVDFIEVGHPAAAPSIRQAIWEIANLNLRARLIGHARLDKGEIRLVRELGLRWVGLFCGINEKSRKKYNLSKQAIYRRTADAIGHAKKLGLSIKFTCEDASRTEPGELIDFYEFLALLGVDRMSYADTVGIVRPEDVEKIHSRVNDRVPFNSLHFHFHNDFGSAGENAVKAMQFGAQCIDASILGIGERAGLVSLEKVLAFLNGKNSKEYKTMQLREAAGLVKNCINREHYKNRRFAHKSGIHINGTIKDPASYEPIEPDSAGAKRILVLSKLIGRSGLQTILSRHGFHHAEQDMTSLLLQIKSEDMLELAGPEEICRYFMERGLGRQEVERA
ncbi:MAG: hypothetical protein A2010_13565 [Nitrospirae bacterium GWD2_57_9]|nr:MAG: hypothetical protein A2010_13565 [Nitrospirae bacterium GWD2_57_9]OGW50407.1 MAG: hypothetical protein A2078_07375 [Nitrospirae bacterium GWC2_57_9]